MKNNYLPLIIIVVLIYMLHTNMDGSKESGDILTQINYTIRNIIKKVKKIIPLQNGTIPELEKNDVIILKNERVNASPDVFVKPILKKDTISPNPSGSTELRFVEETPKTAWSTVDVSQHPKHYTSNFENEFLDTSGFFNKDNFFHDKLSPYSSNSLPDRCIKDANGEVLCNYNNRLQLIPPTLIQDKENNLVLNSIGQQKGDIFKTVDASNVNTIQNNSYQVWDYENEKLLNGGKYFDNVTASSPDNESFLMIDDLKSGDYSF